MTRLLVSAFLLLTQPAFAGEEDGVLMACVFGDGSTVDISVVDDKLIWLDNGEPYPAMFPENRMAHNPLTTVHTYVHGRDITLTVFQLWYSADNPPIERGTALLSRAIVTPEGQLEMQSLDGNCKWMNE